MSFVAMGILRSPPDSHSRSPASWYEPPTNAIAYACMKLPAVLFPLVVAATTPVRRRIRTQPSTRIYDREAKY